MNHQTLAINFTRFQNVIFHSLFFFIISAQIVLNSYTINFLYLLGCMIFIRSDYEFNWKLIVIISFYGLYQDTLLGYQFGFSSIIFLFFFFLGQVSNIFSGIGASLINLYFLIFGFFILTVIKGFYLYLSHNIILNFSNTIINFTLFIILYFLLKKCFNSSILLNG